MKSKETTTGAKTQGDGPPPCMMYVDKDGNWFHKGAPIIHRGFLRLFYQSLCRDRQGRYLIQIKDQVCRLDVEDTPFVVTGVDFVAGTGKEKDRFVLRLIDETQEDLAPDTLFVGLENVLYCKIRKGIFRARFSRPAYYHFATFIELEAETDRFFVLLNGTKAYIRNDPP